MSYYKATYAELDANVQHLLSLPLVQKLIKENEELKQENKNLVNSLVTLIKISRAEDTKPTEPVRVPVKTSVKTEPVAPVKTTTIDLVKKEPVVPTVVESVKKTTRTSIVDPFEKSNRYYGIEPDVVDVVVPEDDLELLEIKQNESENIYFDIEEKPIVVSKEEVEELEEVEEEEEVEELEEVEEEEEVEELEEVEEEEEEETEEVEVEEEEDDEECREEPSRILPQEVEEEVEEEEEEEETELEEMVINGKTYFVTGTENGSEVYEKTADDDIGDLLGTLKNGKIVKAKTAK